RLTPACAAVPSPTLFRSSPAASNTCRTGRCSADSAAGSGVWPAGAVSVVTLSFMSRGRLSSPVDLVRLLGLLLVRGDAQHADDRSEEHTSELQSPDHLVC